MLRKLVLASFLAVLIWTPAKGRAETSDSFISASEESIIRTNNLAINKLVFKIGSGSLVHSTFKNQIFVSERLSGIIKLFKLSGKELLLESQLQIIHELDKILILDIHSAGLDDLYISYVDYSDSIGSCGTTKITHLKKFKSQKVIYKSTPCLSGVGAWSEIAGRMTSDGKSLFMTGGNIFTDLYRNQFPRGGLCCDLPKSYKETMRTSNLYGKIVSVDLKNLKAETFASGFRGPQGLAWDEYRGRLWETEHGPQGGDELNDISKGKDYGWPFVTFGLPYVSEFAVVSGLPKQAIYGNHTGYTPPVFYWSPSIAPSQLIIFKNDSPFFKSFPNDLVVSSLKDKSLIKISMTKSGAVKSTERIEIGARIRDLSSTSVGLVLSTDYGDLIVLSPNFNVDLVGPYPPVGERP